MRISIPRIFGGPAPSPEPAPAPATAQPIVPRDVGESTEQFGVPVTYMRSDVPEINSAFGYGHLDGRRGVSPESFRDFIGHTVEGEAIERLLAELETRERAAMDRAASLRTQRAEIAGRLEELNAARARKAAADLALSRAEPAVKEAAAETERYRESASVSQAAIFLIAGAVFIFGDVVMSRKIVADALSLTGTRIFNLVDESWIFAVGLAMISIILKPAYDRLIEGPYWEGKKTRFAGTICTLALASFVTLWILGDFRFESHGHQQQIDSILEGGSANTAALLQVQQAMASSWLGRMAFILSGLLFAAAGAVSLSIGMRYARQYWWGRRPAGKRLDDAERGLKDARAEQRNAETDLFSRTSELERLTVLVRDEPEAVELERRADEVAAERRTLLDRFVDIRTLRLRSLYDDGYQLGAAQSSEAAAASEERPRRKRPRPFVALRRAIRELSLTPNTLN